MPYFRVSDSECVSQVNMSLHDLKLSGFYLVWCFQILPVAAADPEMSVCHTKTPIYLTSAFPCISYLLAGIYFTWRFSGDVNQ